MSKQSAGDRSVLVSAGGAVNVTAGLSMSETQELFRMMLRENLAGIQAEAYQVAEARNEKLIGDFLRESEARFGAEIEQKLSGFRDPGAQFALRHAQAEYCKYGSEEAEADAIELLISRLNDDVLIGEKIVIDEAIKLCGRLSKRQIDLLCFVLLMYKVRYNQMGTDQQFGELIRRAGLYLDGWNCQETEIALLSHAGAMQQFTGTRKWLPLPQVLKVRYAGLLLSGQQPQYFGVPESLWQETLTKHVRNPTLAQPNHVDFDAWETLLIKKGLSAAEASNAKGKATENALSDAEVMDLIVQHSPEFDAFKDRILAAEEEFFHYNLTPIGIAIALARTRRDGWRPETTLSSLLSLTH